MDNWDEQKLYSIGQFAEIGDASIKQLRYLEHKKILQPDVRNPENNYRYYSEKQLDKLVYIKSLRDLGFGLNQIKDLAQSGSLQSLIDTLRVNLNGVKKEIADVMKKYDNMVDHLIHINNCVAILKEHTLRNAENEIEVVNVPSKLLLYIRDRHPANVEQLFVERMAALKKIAADNHLLTEGAFAAIFHEGYRNQFVDSYGDLETVYEIKGSQPIEAKYKRFIRKSDTFRGVSAMHVGSYSETQPLYSKMESWADENNIKLSGVAVEEYILGPDLVSNPDEYVTRLVLLIK